MDDMPPIEIVEPSRYRALITQHPDHAIVEIQHGQQPWVTMQTWQVDVASSARVADRRLAINDTARQHGWVLSAQWPRPRHGVTTVDDIVALDWSLILAEVTHRRAQLLELVDQVGAAWQASVIDARRVGQLPVPRVAEASGITPPRVYQILREAPTDKLTQTEALIEQTKRRVRNRPKAQD